MGSPTPVTPCCFHLTSVLCVLNALCSAPLSVSAPATLVYKHTSTRSQGVSVKRTHDSVLLSIVTSRTVSSRIHLFLLFNVLYRWVKSHCVYISQSPYPLFWWKSGRIPSSYHCVSSLGISYQVKVSSRLFPVRYKPPFLPFTWNFQSTQWNSYWISVIQKSFDLSISQKSKDSLKYQLCRVTFTCQACLSWRLKNVILLQIWLHLILFWRSPRKVFLQMTVKINKLEGHHLELLTNAKARQVISITDLKTTTTTTP